MEKIIVDVRLYGPLARYGGEAAGRSFANLHPELTAGNRMKDLLRHLSLPAGKRGITFINGDLSAMPGLQPDLDHPPGARRPGSFFPFKQHVAFSVPGRRRPCSRSGPGHVQGKG